MRAQQPSSAPGRSRASRGVQMRPVGSARTTRRGRVAAHSSRQSSLALTGSQATVWMVRLAVFASMRAGQWQVVLDAHVFTRLASPSIDRAFSSSVRVVHAHFLILRGEGAGRSAPDLMRAHQIMRITTDLVPADMDRDGFTIVDCAIRTRPGCRLLAHVTHRYKHALAFGQKMSRSPCAIALCLASWLVRLRCSPGIEDAGASTAGEVIADVPAGSHDLVQREGTCEQFSPLGGCIKCGAESCMLRGVTWPVTRTRAFVSIPVRMARVGAVFAPEVHRDVEILLGWLGHVTFLSWGLRDIDHAVSSGQPGACPPSALTVSPHVQVACWVAGVNCSGGASRLPPFARARPNAYPHVSPQKKPSPYRPAASWTGLLDAVSLISRPCASSPQTRQRNRSPSTRSHCFGERAGAVS